MKPPLGGEKHVTLIEFCVYITYIYLFVIYLPSRLGLFLLALSLGQTILLFSHFFQVSCQISVVGLDRFVEANRLGLELEKWRSVEYVRIHEFIEWRFDHAVQLVAVLFQVGLVEIELLLF